MATSELAANLIMTDRPLDGIRVIELGQLLAGPFAGTMLGYFGAEVIKVEPPARATPFEVGDCLMKAALLFGGARWVAIRSRSLLIYAPKADALWSGDCSKMPML